MNAYALGNTNGEHQRLERQAEVMSPFTRSVLLAAGLRPGMRVLDVGCGPGCVSRLVAEIVGPAGSVLGVDRDPAVVAKARVRVTGPAVVSFEVADVFDEVPAGPFDAIVGRLILMYAPDPVRVLELYKSRLAPGGILAFQETDIASARTEPPLPTASLCLDRIRRTFAGAGADPSMGLGLDRAFRCAGLVPRMFGGTSVDGHGDGFAASWVAETVRSMLPIMRTLGIADPQEVAIDTLEDRIRGELRSTGAVAVGPLMVGAWASMPA